MNTNKLKIFARSARTKLMSLVGDKLDWVFSNKLADAGLLGKTKEIKALEKRLAEVGREQLVDEVAYTWFNRLMALRFMDANDYTSPRVVSPMEGMTLPAILQEAKSGHIDEKYRVDRDRINALLDGRTPAVNNNPDQEVFRMLLVSACNYWHSSMPFMFEHISDYTELLLPDDLLSSSSIVSDIREGMSVEDCQQEELIGWLYQFYIAEKKEEVEPRKTSKDGLKAEEIPAATQLFTPHWIVRYMVENSLGRIWLTLHPDSRLVDQMPYYIAEPEGERSVIPADIRDIKDIRFIDPCMGSGHVLVYAFELLCKMYEEEGFSNSEIPALIFENNLYGLDIDPRCSQLANFALTMKAQSYYRRFLRRAVKPQAIALENIPQEIIEAAGSFGSGSSIHLLSQASNLGSLISISEGDYSAIRVSGGELWSADTTKLREEARLLSQRYHCVVTNPPYLSISSCNKDLRNIIESIYINGKSDLFSAFILRAVNMCKTGGYISLITLHGWMYISSFKQLRTYLLDSCSFSNLLHIGGNSFPSMNSQIARAVAFVVQPNKHINTTTSCFDLDSVANSHSVNKDKLFIAKKQNRDFYTVNFDRFTNIPSKTFLYSLNSNLIDIFANGRTIGEIAKAKQGLATGDNDRFVRNWNEISMCKISKINGCGKWYFYNKGGNFRKWYGNNNYVVNWENDGYEIKNNFLNGKQRSRPQNVNYYFKEGITYSLIGNTSFCARKYGLGHLFDVGGSAIFASSDIEYKILGFVNSRIGAYLLSKLNPTVNFQVGDISNLPFAKINNSLIENIATSSVNISKLDWDAHETSWDFEQNELVRIRKACGTEPVSLEFVYNDYTTTWEEHFRQLHANEEELNSQFIQIYGLQDELTPDVPLAEITILQQGEIKITDNTELEFQPAVVLKQLMSYAVGCMMGRYSIDTTGLVLANQGEGIDEYHAKVPEPTFAPDDDGIIPVLEGEYFLDDIAERFRHFILRAFGEEKYGENLNFILAHVGDVRKYFYKDFYSDHIKMYKKRPIYWMFSSPKKSFQALVYMHRMRPDTPSKVFSDYLQPYIHKLQEEREELKQKSLRDDCSPREKTTATKRIEQLTKALTDCEDYAKTLLAFASTRPTIDLDDGVRANYTTFKSVLTPIKGLDKEE